MDGVTVYTAKQCPYCVLVKNFLFDQEIPYKEVDVTSNPEIVQQLIQKTGRMGVPQTEVNGQWVVGYDPNAIMKALNK